MTLRQRLVRAGRWGYRLAFRALQRGRLHLVRNHFYGPVPDTGRLPQETWTRASPLAGIDLGADRQRRTLHEIVAPYVAECTFPDRPSGDASEFFLGNRFFEAVDAEVYHGFIRHFKPARIVEIGAGYSTLVACRAAGLNAGDSGVTTRVTAIEPHPREFLRNGLAGLQELIVREVQDVDLSRFTALEAGDILFIDSSHVAKIGSDVLYEYLEILPRLQPGVLVHVHDVFLPYEYPRPWVLEELRFWNEQYVLQAFLEFNADFEVLWAASFASVALADELARVVPSWEDSWRRLPATARLTPTRDGRRVWPVSFWMRRRSRTP